jgi:hypothetical protein
VTNVLIYVSRIHSADVCHECAITVHFSVTAHKAVVESMHCIDALLLLLTLYSFAHLHHCTPVMTAATDCTNLMRTFLVLEVTSLTLLASTVLLLLRPLCYHEQVVLADRLKPDWRGDAGTDAAPVFIETKLEFADDTGQVKVNNFNINFNALNTQFCKFMQFY